jgi:GT2 family glycosyltransferase
MAIDIILLTHNKLFNTTRCIQALYDYTDQNVSPFNLTVIDDSTDNITIPYFKELAKEKGNIKFHHSEIPYKSGNQAINYGLGLTQSNPVVFLCNSTFVEPRWLEMSLRIFANDEKIGLMGVKIIFPDTNMIIEAGELVKQTGDRINIGMYEPSHRYSHITEVHCVGWSVVLMQRAAIPEGGWDENYYIGFRGADDADNCLEVRKAGWKVVYNGLSSCYHLLSSCIGGRTLEGIAEMEENTKRFKAKWEGKIP